jgi:hypothetical protein
MLISVLNIKLTCEWHKAIKLNYKNTHTHVIVVLRVPSTIHDMNAQHWCNDVYYIITLKEVHMQFMASVSWIAVIWYHTQGRTWMRLSADRCSAWTRQKTTLFSGHYLRNRSTLDMVFWVISVYFNISNTLPKSGTFLVGHPVYILITGSSLVLPSVQYLYLFHSISSLKLNDHWKSGDSVIIFYCIEEIISGHWGIVF